MLARSPIDPHGHIDFPIDELSIGTADENGKTYELDVFAYGNAIIGYTLNGDWAVAEVHIDGRRHDMKGRAPASIRLAIDHPLHGLIVQALIDVHGSRINDRVLDRIDAEREAA